MDTAAFFDHRNTIQSLSENDQSQLFDYLEPIKAFARSTYKSLYVIDYEKQAFEYVSDNPLFLCGNTPEEVLKMGYEFYFRHVPKKDLELLVKINDVGFNFYEKIPLIERKKYTISYDFHLTTKEGRKILINQKLTPFFLNNEGKIWKALCIISLSSNKEAGNIRIYKHGENKVHHYDLSNNEWYLEAKIELAKREIEILQLSTRGYTMMEMADIMCVSVDTVKFHRKKLFEKLNVANISEAITYATNNKLI